MQHLLLNDARQIQNRGVPTNLPSIYNATYAGTMFTEIQKSVQLEAGEEIVFWAEVQIRRSWLRSQPGMLALTPRRLILLEHFLLSADRILEMLPATIVNLSENQGSGSQWLEISYASPNSIESLHLRPAFQGRPSSGKFASVLDALCKFRGGQLNCRVTENSPTPPEAPSLGQSHSSSAVFAILCLALVFRVGQYCMNLPSEWRAKQAYDAESSCNSTNLPASNLTSKGGRIDALSGPSSGSFCEIQEMTIFRLWSTRGAPYQHVALIDSRGKRYDDIGALNSVKRDLWLRMRSGGQVQVLLAGGQPAWILHDGDLFETRESPDQIFSEHFTLMAAATALSGLLVAFWIYYRRKTLLGLRRASGDDAVRD